MKRLNLMTAMTTLMILGTLTQGTAPAASSVRIAIAVPGIDGKIAAHAETNGNVTIDEYPSHFAGTLKLLAMSSPTFGRVLSDAVCDTVADRAALAADDSYPADLRQLARDSVRKDNSFTLEASVVSFFATSAFTEAAKAAAEAAGVHAASYQIANPLTGRSFDLSIEFTDQAISKKIGGVEAAAAQLKALVQTSGGLATGKSQGEISAADLVCDLRSGNARIVTKVVGSIDTGNSVEPLFEAAVARSFYQELKADLAETPSSYSAAQKLVAGGIAVADAAKAAGAALDSRSIGVVAAQLFDGRTGTLVDVPADRLQQVLSAPRDGGERFEGTGSLALN